MQGGEGIEHTKSMPSAEASAAVEGRRTADTLPPHWRRAPAETVRPRLTHLQHDHWLGSCKRLVARVVTAQDRGGTWSKGWVF